MRMISSFLVSLSQSLHKNEMIAFPQMPDKRSKIPTVWRRNALDDSFWCGGAADLLQIPSGWLSCSPYLEGWAQPPSKGHPFQQLVSITSFIWLLPRSRDHMRVLEQRWTGTLKVCLLAQLPPHHKGLVQRPHCCWYSPSRSVHLFFQPAITPEQDPKIYKLLCLIWREHSTFPARWLSLRPLQSRTTSGPL